MSGVPDDLDSAAAWFDVLAARRRDRDTGREPSLADYRQRFPELGDELTRRWAQLGADEDRTGVLDADDHFGRYRILHELGHGGQAAVFAAVDTRLGRRVALKLLTPLVGAGSAARLERFRREARIVASLDHPGIAKVFEADVRDGVPYLAMQLVGGETLASLLQARRDRGDPPRSRTAIDTALGWIEAAARALHVAHEAGVVHRDIKPANLRIDERGQPVLLDFGLARVAGVDSDQLTQSGATPGTLAYMAPELLSDGGQALQPDRSADVYGMGVTLFECLTLRLPFRNADRAGLAGAIQGGDLLDARRANPAVPRDVAAIVATATARDPRTRYATAQELAEDLARAHAGEPVHARPVPMVERAIRLVRRHPTATVATLSLLTVFALMAWSLVVLGTRERVASALHRSRTAALGEAEATAALRDLVDAMDRAPDASLRSALLEVLTHCNRAWDHPRERPPHGSAAVGPACSPDGERVASATGGGWVELVAARDGATLARIQLSAARVVGLGYATVDELWIAAADGTVLVVDGRDLSVRQQLDRPAGGQGLAIAPDHRHVALGGDGTLTLVPRADPAAATTLHLAGAGRVRGLRFAPDARHLLALSQRASPDPDAADVAHVVDVDQGVVVATWSAIEQPVLAAAWSADGAHLALAGNAGRIEIRALGPAAPLALCDVGEQVHWLGFDPATDRLLVPDDRGTAVWDWRAAPPQTVQRFTNAPQRTWGAAGFGADGRQLAAVHRDGTVTVFDAATWEPRRTFKHHVVAVRHLQWLPTSGLLLTADLDRITVWHATVRPHAPAFDGHAGAVHAIAHRPDRDEWASAGADHRIAVWTCDASSPRLTLDCAPAIDGLDYTPEGRRLVGWSASPGPLRIWDADTGAPLAALDIDCATRAVLIAPDGRHAIAAGDDGRVRVFDLAAFAPVATFARSTAPVLAVALDPTAVQLAVGGADRWLSVWNWRDGTLVAEHLLSEAATDWRAHPIHEVRALAFSGDGASVHASLVNNKLVTVAADAASGTAREIVVDRFGGPLARVPAAQDHPERLLCADFSFGRLSLVDGTLVHALDSGDRPAHGNRITAVLVAPDGRLAATAAADGLLRIWDLDRAILHAEVRAGAPILAATFDHTGAWIVTGTADGRVSRWPVDSLPLARRILGESTPGRTSRGDR